jgi:hypothetical protein
MAKRRFCQKLNINKNPIKKKRTPYHNRIDLLAKLVYIGYIKYYNMESFMKHLSTLIVILAASIQGCAARLPTAEGRPRIPINSTISDEPIMEENKEAGDATIK